MARWIVVLAVFFLGLPVTEAGASARCPPADFVLDFRVDQAVARPIINNARPQKVIAKQVGGNLHTRAQTKTYTESPVDIRFRVKPRPGGDSWCIYLSKLHIKLHIKDVNVFIAREYQPGTCQYKALMRHEMQHVSIARHHLLQYAPKIRTVMNRYARMMRPQVSRNLKKDQRRLTEGLRKNLQAQRRLMEKDLKAAQKRIDTRASYIALEKECPSW